RCDPTVPSGPDISSRRRRAPRSRLRPTPPPVRARAAGSGNASLSSIICVRRDLFVLPEILSHGRAGCHGSAAVAAIRPSLAGTVRKAHSAAKFHQCVFGDMKFIRARSTAKPRPAAAMNILRIAHRLAGAILLAALVGAAPLRAQGSLPDQLALSYVPGNAIYWDIDAAI